MQFTTSEGCLVETRNYPLHGGGFREDITLSAMESSLRVGDRPERQRLWPTIPEDAVGQKR